MADSTSVGRSSVSWACEGQTFPESKQIWRRAKSESRSVESRRGGGARQSPGYVHYILNIVFLVTKLHLIVVEDGGDTENLQEECFKMYPQSCWPRERPIYHVYWCGSSQAFLSHPRAFKIAVCPSGVQERQNCNHAACVFSFAVYCPQGIKDTPHVSSRLLAPGLCVCDVRIFGVRSRRSDFRAICRG